MDSMFKSQSESKQGNEGNEEIMQLHREQAGKSPEITDVTNDRVTSLAESGTKNKFGRAATGADLCAII